MQPGCESERSQPCGQGEEEGVEFRYCEEVVTVIRGGTWQCSSAQGVWGTWRIYEGGTGDRVHDALLGGGVA